MGHNALTDANSSSSEPITEPQDAGSPTRSPSTPAGGRGGSRSAGTTANTGTTPSGGNGGRASTPVAGNAGTGASGVTGGAGTRAAGSGGRTAGNAGSGQAAGASGARSAAVLSDAQVAAVLQTANAGEIEQNTIARTRGLAPSVRDFAQDLIAAHQASQIRLETLLLDLKLTPEDNAYEDQRLQALSQVSFDMAYLQSQIALHLQVLAPRSTSNMRRR